MGNYPFNDLSYSASVALGTKNYGTAATNLSDPTVFAYYNKEKRGQVSAGGSYFLGIDEPWSIDLTDGAGHGILIATDYIYASFSSAGTGVINSAQVKILYRWKNIGLTEYIGIVQSQQS